MLYIDTILKVIDYCTILLFRAHKLKSADCNKCEEKKPALIFVFLITLFMAS